MRLVALTILLWADVWDRPTIDPESIADRTSLKLSDVMGALDKLEHVGLVECYADGWKLTIQRFKQTVRSWCNRVPM
jgi:DNA-binding MarR family transcriptional regulator